MIEDYTIEVFANYDTNGDALINLGDTMATDKYELAIELCDFDNNGDIDICEVHRCVL